MDFLKIGLQKQARIYIVTLHNMTVLYRRGKHNELTVIKNSVFDKRLLRGSLRKVG